MREKIQRFGDRLLSLMVPNVAAEAINCWDQTCRGICCQSGSTLRRTVLTCCKYADGHTSCQGWGSCRCASGAC